MMGLCVTFPKIDSLVRGIFKSVGSKGEVKFCAGRQKWKVNSEKKRKEKTTQTKSAWVKEVWMPQNLWEAVGPHYRGTDSVAERARIQQEEAQVHATASLYRIDRNHIHHACPTRPTLTPPPHDPSPPQEAQPLPKNVHTQLREYMGSILLGLAGPTKRDIYKYAPRAEQDQEGRPPHPTG